MAENLEHKATAAERLLEDSEKSDKKRLWFMRSVVIFLIMIFIGGIVLGAVSILNDEGQQDPDIPADAGAPPATAEEIIAYVQAAAAIAKQAKPRLTVDTVFYFDNDDGRSYLDTLKFDGGQSDLLTKTAKFLAQSIEDQLHTSAPMQEIDFGKDYGSVLWAMNVTPEALAETKVEYVFYRCRICHREDSEAPDVCPECQSEDAYRPAYRDNYTITLTFADPETGTAAAVTKNFHPRDAAQIHALLNGALDKFVTIQSVATRHHNAAITAEINRETQQIRSLCFAKDVDVSLHLLPQGDVSFVGDTRASLTLRESTNFRFDWPEVRLDKTELTMKTHETAALQAQAIAPEGTKITWSCPQEGIVTVDADGYVKSGNQYGEADVVASFELDGQTYSRSCHVWVKNAAEDVTLNHRKLSLAPGGSAQLAATVKPAKATIKTVTWYTEDPAVVTVDETGLVTAVGPGTAKVYALSDDGHYRSSCAVSVKGGNSNGQ
ncbi:MAG: Ig-like domain-containing protein [Oscillospiraceae bacterium]|jgi:uncharacterized protein YjdB|nr:Ig-like domain-containing protein [Oscillospiraceae bacterium]